jgi:hypothetical protein
MLAIPALWVKVIPNLDAEQLIMDSQVFRDPEGKQSDASHILFFKGGRSLQ